MNRALAVACLAVVLVPGCINFDTAASQFCDARPQGFCEGTDGSVDGQGGDGGNTDGGDSGSPLPVPETWGRAIGGSSVSFLTALRTDVFPDGGVVLGGSFTGNPDFGGGQEVSPVRAPFFARYDDRGALVSSFTFGANSGGTGISYVSGVAAEAASRSAYVFGFTDSLVVWPDGGSLPGPKGWMARMDEDGGAGLILSISTGTSTSFTAGPIALAPKTSTLLLAGGASSFTPAGGPSSGSPYPAMMYVGYHTDGGYAFEGSFNCNCMGCGGEARNATADPVNSELYIAGYGQGTCAAPSGPFFNGLAGGTFLLVKLSSAGTFQWWKAYPGLNGGTRPAVAAKNGVVWTAAEVPVSYDAGDAVGEFPASGGSDIVLQQVDAFGTPILATALSGPGLDHVSALKIDESGSLWMFGDFQGSGFGAGTLHIDSADGGRDLFVARYDTSGALQELRALQADGDETANEMIVGPRTLTVAGGFTLRAAVGDGGIGAPGIWTPNRGYVGTVAR